MQKQSNVQLFEALVEAIPPQFAAGLLSSYPRLCAEAEQVALGHPLIEEPEAKYVIPHFRRGLVETAVRRLAREAGLETYARPNANGSSSFTMVKAGRFVLTASYVETPGKNVRRAIFRSEAAELNEFLDQLDMFGYDEAGIDKQEIVLADAIYGILLYGGEGGGSFMEVALPNQSGSGYVERYKLSDILEASNMRNTEATDSDKFDVSPKPRRNRKDGSTGESGKV
ncbi:hypothetical protein [Delftia sp. JD2]|uniref:hypothetical protein n=1 Tax=Delftia sp. JD2 TaxID=469553 RepID=UPI001112BDAF|nr:hypothetical protein [Delftia sp. JD2]